MLLQAVQRSQSVPSVGEDLGKMEAGTALTLSAPCWMVAVGLLCLAETRAVGGSSVCVISQRY